MVVDPCTLPTAAKKAPDVEKTLGWERRSQCTTHQNRLGNSIASVWFGDPILPSRTARAQQPAIQALRILCAPGSRELVSRCDTKSQWPGQGGKEARIEVRDSTGAAADEVQDSKDGSEATEDSTPGWLERGGDSVRSRTKSAARAGDPLTVIESPASCTESSTMSESGSGWTIQIASKPWSWGCRSSRWLRDRGRPPEKPQGKGGQTAQAKDKPKQESWQEKPKGRWTAMARTGKSPPVWRNAWLKDSEDTRKSP